MAKEQNGLMIGQAIASLRKQNRWTQRELAQRMHVHHAMVARWEKGHDVPRDTTLERIAAALNVTVEELVAAERKQPFRMANPVNDPELQQMLAQLNDLDSRDLEAVKIVLDAVLTKAKLRAMVGPGVIAHAS